jgi:hypothetical protein
MPGPSRSPGRATRRPSPLRAQSRLYKQAMRITKRSGAERTDRSIALERIGPAPHSPAPSAFIAGRHRSVHTMQHENANTPPTRTRPQAMNAARKAAHKRRRAGGSGAHHRQWRAPRYEPSRAGGAHCSCFRRQCRERREAQALRCAQQAAIKREDCLWRRKGRRAGGAGRGNGVCQVLGWDGASRQENISHSSAKLLFTYTCAPDHT